MYTFRELCDQDINLKLNDGTTKIFLSIKGTFGDVLPGITAFLDYVDSGIVSGDFVKELAVAEWQTDSGFVDMKMVVATIGGESNPQRRFRRY